MNLKKNKLTLTINTKIYKNIQKRSKQIFKNKFQLSKKKLKKKSIKLKYCYKDLTKKNDLFNKFGIF